MKRKARAGITRPGSDGLVSVYVVLTGGAWANSPDYDDE